MKKTQEERIKKLERQAKDSEKREVTLLYMIEKLQDQIGSIIGLLEKIVDRIFKKK